MSEERRNDMILIKCLRPLIAPLRLHTNDNNNWPLFKWRHQNKMPCLQRHWEPNKTAVTLNGIYTLPHKQTHIQFSEFVTFHFLLLYYLLSLWAVLACDSSAGAKGFAIKSCMPLRSEADCTRDFFFPYFWNKMKSIVWYIELLYCAACNVNIIGIYIYRFLVVDPFIGLVTRQPWR